METIARQELLAECLFSRLDHKMLVVKLFVASGASRILGIRTNEGIRGGFPLAKHPAPLGKPLSPSNVGQPRDLGSLDSSLTLAR